MGLLILSFVQQVDNMLNQCSPVVNVGGNARECRSWAPQNGCKRSTFYL